MDHREDHATKCAHGFGITHRHNTLRNSIARNVFKPAGLAYNIEVPFLIPDTALGAADILVQPGPTPPGTALSRPTAYDVTVRSPYTPSILNIAATTRAGAAEAADKDKLSTLQRNLRDALNILDQDPIPPLDWTFCPLAFDSLGAPSVRTISVIEDHARKIAFRSCTSYASAKLHIEQGLSYSVWSSTAEAILFRMPSRVAAFTHPLQI